MKVFIILGLMLSILMGALFSCKEKYNCHNIPTEFKSFDEAKKEIKSRSFRFIDSIKVRNSLVMTAAKFFSCDNNTGYLFYTRKSGNEYFFSDVPFDYWVAFKKSDNIDSFFQNNIEGRFTSIIIFQDQDLK